jgi:hypothetical protein
MSMKEFGKTCYKQGQEAERLRTKKIINQMFGDLIIDSESSLISGHYAACKLTLKELKKRLEKEPEKEEEK